MKKSLNIFTDASIVHTNGAYGTIGCAGFISAVGNGEEVKLQTLDRYYTILLNTTNNIAEATGVLRAVQYAVVHRDMFTEINIFSDSQWCIRSITTWIFNWISTINTMGIMYNSSQEPVANQNIFSEIILTIVQSNTKIHFYHCKGHVKDTPDSIFDALKTFRISNHIKRDVHLSYQEIYVMAYYNDLVDRESRENAQWFANNGSTSLSIDYPRPFFYILNRDVLDIYKHLIE